MKRFACCATLLVAAFATNVHAAPSVEMTILPNGAIEIEGSRYSTVEALKSEMLSIKRRTPPLRLQVVIRKGVSYDAVANALRLLQATGEYQIGTGGSGADPPNPR